ncbi:Armadillo-type fold protein [Metarhizium album ARSEF 1941]|uniref:Armadillo-type fold protein n=1 Tax=Metarhizium album (strain ARSEF 1941) TaxID=1081103 RepID=A0A0B2WJD3_METAS|nr:Armadillo-type fold protein [Metarhizium album ARSEF 1941]KHN93774.1 Armadillo-type fold protein [Metarhizium album ARSEF 1941]
MEQQLVPLLTNIQLPDQAPRQQAEIELKRAQANPAFPVSLAKIASHSSISTGVRQAALSTLRQFIENNWAVGNPDQETIIPIDDDTRAILRQSLLDLALSQDEDRKVKISASYAVGKIAIHDFPEQWPSLLPTVLNTIPAGTDTQLHGALRVLADLVDESLSEDQFFSMARDIAKILTEVALNENRKPMLRALAISVFRSCFDLMNMVKEEHSHEVKAFAEELLAQWNPFFANVLKSRLPEGGVTTGPQPGSWNHIVALKLQVVKTLLRIRRVFPNLLLPQSTTFFSAVWEELNLLQTPYEELYIKTNAQSRLVDSDNLPYTLDFLVLEELDFLNQCFRSPPVKAELDGHLQAHASAQDVPWMVEIMRMLVSYSRVTQEEEELWDIDCSLYLAEETSVTANYTARTAAGDLLIKMGEWFNEKAVDGLFGFTTSLFPGDGSMWRCQESALSLFTMLLSDFQDLNKTIPDPVASAYLELVDFTINKPDEPLLRARGYLVAGIIGRSFQTPPALLDRMVHAITNEESEVVQVACIKAVEGLIHSGRVGTDRQVPIVTAIQSYMNEKDPAEMEEADELLVVLAEALRATIGLDPKIALSSDIQSTDLLFMLAKLGASNFQVTMIITEAFEDIVSALSDSASFGALCARTLPTLTGAFDVANVTEDNPLVTVATELLVVLAENGSEPLPTGFVATIFPKLNRLLMESEEGEVLRPGSEIVKWVLSHDHQQVFNWQDANGRSGLEVCLHIIDRLLGPSIEDNSASEVGGLAAELVEKAGQERLGPFLPQLLQAVANRLASAQAAAFIQSLILVFARLSLNGAQDVVEFLSQIQIQGDSGLQIVMAKWLENSVSFAGYDEIRQNVIALSKLYALNDSRLAQIQVKGDLILSADDGKIKTRSRAKQNPDQYTIIPAPLKIVKVLIEELASAAGAGAAASAAAAAVAAAEFDEDNDEDGWEDDDDTLDLSLAGTKADLMSFMDGGPLRRPDDETHMYLTEFFVRCGRENIANFQEWYNLLTQDEKTRLNQVANSGA